MTPLMSDRLSRAQGFERDGDFVSALNEYRAIAKEDRGCRSVFFNLGALYSRMKRYEEALNCYRHILSIKEDYLVYFNMGSVFYRMEEYKKAVIFLNRSKSLNNGFSLTTLVMGLAFSRMDDKKAAESCFRETLIVLPDNRVALNAMAILCYNNRRYDEALTYLDRIKKNDPENVKIRQLRTSVLLDSGRMKETAEEIQNLRKISDGCRLYDEYIRSVSVEAYTDRYGTIDEKIAILKAKDQNDKNNLISLSLCHMFKGEQETAINLLLKAREQLLN